ncbi:MAG: MOSC domain-containing protein [Proteobacteria bacterium]|nr:MOSC domain-containing protein [Pseudomonadota bacterium]
MNHCDGQVLSVARDPEHSFAKQLQKKITLIEAHGVEADAHSGQYARSRFLGRMITALPNKRQIHLLPAELFAELRHCGHAIGPGLLGENIATVGLKLEHFPLGTRIFLGASSIVELTGIRTPCRKIDRFQSGLKEMLRTDATGPKYKCGVLGVVLRGGAVMPGDIARVELPLAAYSPLPAL